MNRFAYIFCVIVVSMFLYSCGSTGVSSIDELSPVDEITDAFLDNDGDGSHFTTISSAGTDTSSYSRVVNRTISLAAGWNLLVIPIDRSVTSVEYAAYFGDFTDVYKYDNSLCDEEQDLSAWNSADTRDIGDIFAGSACWVHNPVSIEPGEGFWVYANSAYSHTFLDGDVYGIDQKVSELDAGWNLVGSGYNTLAATFSDLSDYVWTFNTNDSTWTENPVAVTGGKGFWYYKSDTVNDTIETLASADLLMDTTPKDGSYETVSTECIESGDTIICTDDGRSVSGRASVGQPLFLDGEFKGMVTSISSQGGQTTYSLGDAEYVTDVYDNFDIELSADEITARLARAVKTFKGKYDDINEKPLSFSLVTVDVPESRSGGDDVKELVLRVNFPKGYKIPIQPRNIDCDFLDASCDASFEVEENKEIPLNSEYTKGGITVSTNGSYVDFGIGAYMRAKYDANLIDDDEYAFEVRTSAYFESNIVFTINGEYEFEWSDDIELMDMVDVEIRHPYSAVAKVVIGFQPVMEIGSRGSLDVSLEAKARSKREGTVGFRYSSVNDRLIPFGSVSFKKYNENGVQYEATVNGEVYAIPRVAARPKLIFLRIAQPLSFGEIRGGVKVNSLLEGEVHTGFVVGNDGLNVDIGKTEIGLDIGVSALIDYIIQIRLGDKEFWTMDDYDELYESDRLVVFDWKIGLLDSPEYDVSYQDSHQIEFYVMGNEFPDETKYYVRVIGEGENYANPNLLDFRESASLIDGNTIRLDETATLLVQAVRYNKDISDSVWRSYGVSLSPVALHTVEIAPQEEDEEDEDTGVQDPPENNLDDFTFEEVTSPYTGKVWMDRNLGASRVCQSYIDSECYGGYYQFQGEDWSCPDGFRVPTIDEIVAETIDAGMDTIWDVANSFLKIPSAGYKQPSQLWPDHMVGESAILMTSEACDTGTSLHYGTVFFQHAPWLLTPVNNGISPCAFAQWLDYTSVRCIKEQ